MFRPASVSCLIVAALAAGCASAARPTTPRSPSNEINRQEIERMNVSTAYDVLETKLNRSLARPLRGGATSFERPQQPLVVIDGNLSEVAALRTLPASNIEGIEILNATEGTMRYGTGATNGVIVIKCKK